jgi:hypothetical protein
MGKLAQEKGASEGVRSFGQTLQRPCRSASSVVDSLAAAVIAARKLTHDAHRAGPRLGTRLRLSRMLDVEVCGVELSGFLQAVPYLR